MTISQKLVKFVAFYINLLIGFTLSFYKGVNVNLCKKNTLPPMLLVAYVSGNYCIQGFWF